MTFIEKIKAEARKSETGWNGDDRIFIAHAWKEYRKIASGNYRDFQERLITECRAHLTRCDMPREDILTDIAVSEIQYDTGYAVATYHLIKM